MKHLSIGGDWINALLQAFANLGLDITAITEGLPGFEGTRFRTGQRLEISSARRMYHRADQLAQDPLLGLKLGLSQNYRSVGVLAPVLWHSLTVREALTNIVRYQKLISESGLFHPKEIKSTNPAEHRIHFEYVPTADIVPVNPHQVLAVITGTIGIITGISNHKVVPTQLSVPSSLNADLLSKHLPCAVIEGDDNLVLTFSCEFLDEELDGRDPHLYELNRTYAEELLRAKNEGIALIDTVKEAIRSWDFKNASMDTLEQELGIHKRVLQRNLSEQGTNFRALKEEVFKEYTAQQLLVEKVNIESVALALGYSEPSAFHRAFKGWFGVTPKQFTNTR